MSIRVKNSVLEFNIVDTIDMENIASWNSDYALLILRATQQLIFENGE